MSMIRPDTDQEPSPASYQKDLADGQVFTRAPAVIHAVQTNSFGLWGRPGEISQFIPLYLLDSFSCFHFFVTVFVFLYILLFLEFLIIFIFIFAPPLFCLFLLSFFLIMTPQFFYESNVFMNEQSAPVNGSCWKTVILLCLILSIGSSFLFFNPWKNFTHRMHLLFITFYSRIKSELLIVDRSPGPAAYSPSLTFVKRSQPSFSLSRSSREGLKPLLGPFASS